MRISKRFPSALINKFLLSAALVAPSVVVQAQTLPAAARSFTSTTASADEARDGKRARRLAAGERALYEVRLAGRGVGSGSIEIGGEERIDGFNTLHATMQLSAGVLFAKVNDRFDSWIDPERRFSRRFVQDQKELTNKRYRDYRFAPERKKYRQVDSGEEGVLHTDEPLDDVSFLFYVRTLPLRVGDVDTIPRYFKAGRDVIIRVLRKQKVQVPAGTFETIVVQPTITNAGGLFGQGGQAEIYLSDDDARTLVMMKSKVPVLGSLSLHLREFRPGT